MATKNSIQVAIKVRPLVGKEKDCPVQWQVIDNSVRCLDGQSEPYYFDHIFKEDSTNEMIFDVMAKQIVHAAVQGFNGTIFAYGQTSSGKTYTMLGDEENPGVMVLAAREIFKEIDRSEGRQFLLRVGFIEIYNEKMYDLFNKRNSDLKIHETTTGHVSVNSEEIVICTEDDILRQLYVGMKERTVRETQMNERSSRSHAIFRIVIESRAMKEDASGEDTATISVLNLVDLAGSERANQTGATGIRLKEGALINKSLLFLSNVIKSLSDENEDNKYISYRDSKLTRILQDSLGGNALTTIICTIKPSVIEETQSTLNFAMRAKTIKNKPKVNEIVSESTMMRRLEREIKMLKARLDEERVKNESKIKVGQLEEHLKQEVLKLITANSLRDMRTLKEKRRRTWCPANTGANDKTFEGAAAMPATVRERRIPVHKTPLITVRSMDHFQVRGMPEDTNDDLEPFVPAEDFNFCAASLTKHEEENEKMGKISLSPNTARCTSSSCEKLEQDFIELQEFTNLEKQLSIERNLYKSYEDQLKQLRERNTFLEKEHLDYINLKHELDDVKAQWQTSDKCCNNLRLEIEELRKQNNVMQENLAKKDVQLLDLAEDVKRLQMENQSLVDVDVECERLRNRAKQREAELLQLIKESDEQNATKQCIKCADLESDVKAQEKHEIERESLLEEIKNMRQKLENLQQEYQQICAENAIKSEECNTLNTAVADAEQKFNILQNKYNDLDKIWKDQQITINSLQAEYNLIQGKYNALQQEYKRLEEMSEESSVKCNQLHSENRQLQTEIQQLKQKVSEMQTKLLEDVYLQQIKEIEVEKLELQQQHNTLENEYETLSLQLIESVQEGDLLREKCKTLENELAKLKEQNIQNVNATNNVDQLYLKEEKDEYNMMSFSLKSSGFGSVNEYEMHDMQHKLSKFLSTVNFIELLHIQDTQNRVFKINAAASSTEFTQRKLLLDCSEIHEADINGSSHPICMQGCFRNLKFHIMDIKEESQEIEVSDSFAALQQQINDLQETCANLRKENKELLESNEGTIAEMREQIQILSNELFEKTTCLDQLEKEKAEMSMQIKRRSISFNVTNEFEQTLNGSASKSMRRPLEEVSHYTLSENDVSKNNNLLEYKENTFICKEDHEFKIKELLQELQKEKCFSMDLQHQIRKQEKEFAMELVAISNIRDNLMYKSQLQSDELKRLRDHNVRALEKAAEVAKDFEIFSKEFENYEDLKQKNVIAEENLEELKKKLLETEQFIQTLQLEFMQKLEISENGFREHMNKCQVEWEKDRGDYLKEIDKRDTEIKEIKTHMNKIQKELDKERDIILLEKEELSCKLETALGNLANNKDEIAKLVQANEDSKLKNVVLSENMEKLIAEKNELEAKLEKLAENLELAEEKHIEKFAKVEDTQRVLLQEKESLQKELKHKSTEVESLTEENAKLLKMMETQHEDLDKLRTTLKELEAKSQVASEQLNKEKQSLDNERQQLKAELNKKTLELNELNEMLEKITSERGKLQEEQIKWQQEKLELIAQQKETLENLKHLHAEELQAELRKSKENNDFNQIQEKYEFSIKEHENKQKMLHEKIAVLEQKLENAEKQYIELAKERQELIATSEQKKATLLQLQEKYTQSQEFHEQLKSVHTQLEKEKLSLEAAVAHEKMMRCQLEQQQKLMAEQSIRIKQELETKLKQCELLHQQQIEKYVAERANLRVRSEQLEQTNSVLLLEKKTLEDRIYDLEILVKKSELSLSNTSIEVSTTSSNASPKYSLKEKTAVERKNRRISTHDDNRREMFMENTRHVACMTDPSDQNCIYMQLENKLKECEKQLFISQSKETALKMELRNHPLKAKNAELTKRIKEEQEKHRAEVKKFKEIILEKTKDSAMTKQTKSAGIASVQVQTIEDSGYTCQLELKCRDLEACCNQRMQTIEALKSKISEQHDKNIVRTNSEFEQLKQKCQALQDQLEHLESNYTDAKKVLKLRRNEIERLNVELSQLKTPVPTSKVL